MIRMLPIILSALVLAGTVAPAAARDRKEPSPQDRPAPSLRVGDPAPALIASRWLQGAEVRKFERGKIYVVEFWATWCGALHGFMPQLDDLQARYRDRGVTIISFTFRDIRGVSGNTEQDVAEFLREQRPPLHHAFAYANDGAAGETWLRAAGQDSFCTFVVDRAGRIAYMGHPMFLDLVLSKVLAGERAKAVGDEMGKVVAEYKSVFDTLIRDFKAGRDMTPGLRALQEFEARYPPLADLLPVVQAELSFLPKYGRPGEAKAYAGAILAKGIRRQDARLLELAWSILRDQKQSKELLALARKAAEARVRMDGGTNARSLLDLADAHLVNGDRAGAKEYARKAIEAAAGESPAVREQIEKQARRLGAER